MTLKNPDYHTVAQAAQLLAVSRITIHRMIASGDLQAVKIGASRGVWRIPEDALRAYLPPEPDARQVPGSC